MSMKKRLFAVAAVSALTVATAVPALALENEFHGLFRLRGIIDNFNDGGAGAFSPVNNPRTKNYIEQRARLMYIAKANDDLKLVTHFEIDSRWGDTSYGTGRGAGGGIGADQTNLETKNVYLDFNIPSTPLNVKLGIQGFDDGYKGVIFNNDAAGVVAKAKMGFGSLGGAYFRFDDAVTGGSYLEGTVTNTTPGYLTRDLVNLNAKVNITKDVKVGADWYLLYSDVMRQTQDRTAINMVGVNAEAKVGPATIDGFVLYQNGKMGATVPGNSQKVSAFAGNVGAKLKTGPGTLRANALYISGDKSGTSSVRNDFQTVADRTVNQAAHAFYAAEMQILLRNKFNMNSDRAIVQNLNNGGRGLYGGFVGYDLAIDKFFMNSNIGAAAISRDLNGANRGGDFLGTEVNTEVGYKLFDNMTTSVQAGYMFLGNYYKPVTTGSWPENPYTAKLQVNYTF